MTERVEGDDERLVDSDLEQADGQGNELTPLQGAALLIRSGTGPWTVPETDSWDVESSLRDIVVENPTILPGVADPGAAAVKELYVNAVGRVDVLCIEPSGVITLCEAKLRRNSEIRRQVIGQVFAYASGLAEMTYAELEQAWAKRSGSSLATSVLGDNADEADVQQFVANVSDRLGTGRFRLVVAVDELTDELRRTVGYLATHMTNDVQVVALELAYAKHGDVEMLVPRSWGAELSGTKQRATPSATPGERRPVEAIAEVAAEAEKRRAGAGVIVTTIVDSLRAHAPYLYFGNPAEPQCVVTVTEPLRCHPFVIRPQQGGVRLVFQWMRNLGDDRLGDLVQRLETSDVLAPLVSDVRGANFRKRTLLPFEVLADPATLQLVVDAVQEALA